MDVRLSCARGEGALLNLETGNAKFSFCEEPTKQLLKSYLKENYRDWIEQVPASKDLFLVTGTYMTKNWENAVIRVDSHSGGGGVSVEAGNIEGHFAVDWQTLRGSLYSFQTGHTHPDVPVPDHNLSPSFTACCHCETNGWNQCIFVRGWRVKMKTTLFGTKLAKFMSVEASESTVSRNILRGRSRTLRGRFFSMDVDTPSCMSRSEGEIDEDQVMIEEVEGTPKDDSRVSLILLQCYTLTIYSLIFMTSSLLLTLQFVFCSLHQIQAYRVARMKLATSF